MTDIRSWLRALAAAAILMLLPSCVNDDGGTEIPNELAGREFIAGKGPAADAELRLVPVGFVPGSTKDPSNTIAFLFTARTDANGRFAFNGVPAGQYNLIASQDGLQSFRDSIAVTGKAQDLADDTLRTPSSLTGKVVLAPQDDPRKAIVHLLGTTQFANVPESGWFTLRDLGPGRYRLRVSVPNSSLYTDAFVPFVIDEGRNDTLAEPIVPFFDGIPGVEGLKAEAGPDGTMLLTWKKPISKRISGFLLYRDLEGATLPTDTPLVRIKRTDTSFIDTVYRRTARQPDWPPPPPPKHYDYFDTVAHTVSYHVNILDNSGAVGPTLEIVEATAQPPSLKGSGKWKRISDGFWRRKRNSIVLTLRDSLFAVLTCDSAAMRWESGFPAMDEAPEVLASSDGITWSPVVQTDKFQSAILSATVWRDNIWALALKPHAAPDSLAYPVMSLLSSRDGATWKTMVDSLPVEYRHAPGFFPMNDSLYVVAGHSFESLAQPLPTWKSPDGLKWDQRMYFNSPRAVAPGIAPLPPYVIAIGGGLGRARLNEAIFSTWTGASWDSLEAPAGLLPRVYNSATAHMGNLWVIGGYPDPAHPEKALSDVWVTYDGRHWQLVDGHAPFPGRGNHSAFSFRGKLWVVGGFGADGPLGDVWVMEP